MLDERDDGTLLAFIVGMLAGMVISALVVFLLLGMYSFGAWL